MIERKSSLKIEFIFIFAIFTMFAVTTFLVVIIGANQYRTTADAMNENYEVRTATSYIQERLRRSDSSCGIHLTTLSGTQAIELTETENDVPCTTYLYFYDGALRELLVTDASVFRLGAGQTIIELHGMDIRQLPEDILEITFTGTDESTYTTLFFSHSSQGKEAL